MKNTYRSCRATVLALLVLMVLGGRSPPAFSSTRDQPVWSGIVTYVVDGDSIHVRPSGGGPPVHIRVDGIDAPEICQPGGRAARDALKRRALGQLVVVNGRRHDDYGRVLAKIELHDHDLGKWMVATGQAWSYRHRSSPGPYATQQRLAQAGGLGIFSRAHAVPAVYPGVFRKQHGTCYPPNQRGALHEP
jgi:micrococcal nuclease